ncbi:MAG: amidohydrolase family protein [Vicinamibacterales bacterium]
MTRAYPISTVLAAALLLPALTPAATAQAPPIIDMHMHAFEPPGVPGGAPSLCRPEPCTGDGHAAATSEEALTRTLEAMDRDHVVKGFLSGAPETVRAWMRAAPDRFIPAPFVLEPGMPAVEALTKEFDAGHLRGVGEIATQLNGIAPNDPRLEPYFALADERDVPVLIHTLGIGPYLPGFRSSAGSPLLLEDVLVRHPTLRLYVENAGYPFRDQMIAMMTQYPQLYADVSTITWVIPREAFNDYLQAFVRAGLEKRIMFGSDQMLWPEKIGAGIEAIRQAPFLSDAQRRDILYGNAARFLRLDDAPPSAAGGPGA